MSASRPPGARARLRRPVRGQGGVAMVEFAILAVGFFMVLFGAVEVSRLLFTWNALDAVTQRAARIASICPPGSAAAKRYALFDTPGGSDGILPGFTDANLEITYLDGAFNPTTALPISHVRARIVDFEHQMAIPFVSGLVESPQFEFILPAESLGYVPNTGAYTC